MKLTDKNINELSIIAINAAQKAGAYIAESVSKHLIVNKKEGGNNYSSQVVTEVDLKSQVIILNILEPTLNDYQLALLTEESIDDKSRLEREYFWCIDPLDGTLPFINGNPGYSVSIALVKKDGTPLIGIVFDPVKNVLYSAIKGLGAYRNGIAFSSSEGKTKQKPLTLVSDSSFFNLPYYSSVESNLIKFSEELGYDGYNTILIGGAVMNAMWVLENSPACYFKFPKTQNGGGSIWDYAASACIFKEAGAWVSDIFGSDLDLNNAYSTFMNKKGIIYASNNQLAQLLIELNCTL